MTYSKRSEAMEVWFHVRDTPEHRQQFSDLELLAEVWKVCRVFVEYY